MSEQMNRFLDHFRMSPTEMEFIYKAKALRRAGLVYVKLTIEHQQALRKHCSNLFLQWLLSVAAHYFLSRVYWLAWLGILLFVVTTWRLFEAIGTPFIGEGYISASALRRSPTRLRCLSSCGGTDAVSDTSERIR